MNKISSFILQLFVPIILSRNQKKLLLYIILFTKYKINYSYTLFKIEKCVRKTSHIYCTNKTNELQYDAYHPLFTMPGDICQRDLCQGNPLPPVKRMTGRCKKTLSCPNSYTCNMYEKVLVYIFRFSVASASASASVTLFITQGANLDILFTTGRSTFDSIDFGHLVRVFHKHTTLAICQYSHQKGVLDLE